MYRHCIGTTPTPHCHCIGTARTLHRCETANVLDSDSTDIVLALRSPGSGTIVLQQGPHKSSGETRISAKLRSEFVDLAPSRSSPGPVSQQSREHRGTRVALAPNLVESGANSGRNRHTLARGRSLARFRPNLERLRRIRCGSHPSCPALRSDLLGVGSFWRNGRSTLAFDGGANLVPSSTPESWGDIEPNSRRSGAQAGVHAGGRACRRARAQLASAGDVPRQARAGGQLTWLGQRARLAGVGGWTPYPARPPARPPLLSGGLVKSGPALYAGTLDLMQAQKDLHRRRPTRRQHKNPTETAP